MDNFTIFIIAFLLSVIFTALLRRLVLKLNITDEPSGERKIHRVKTPLLGGAAIFLCFFIILYFVRDKVLIGDLETRHWLGFFTGACFLMIGGFLDDKYNLKPKFQIIFPILAIISVLVGGVSIEKVTNPLGGFIYLGAFSGALIAVWLLGMMYTTKLLDGVDGLVTGVTAIGGFIIFLFTMTTKYYQPDIGLAALILAAACIGFLIFNWHPAKIFLGEGGSLFLGYALGVLAIISGGKIAIALLVMGIPIMDVAWTIIRRIFAGQNPFKFADKKHLHFRLLDLGLSQKKVVLLYYGFAAIFGLSALFLQSTGKMFVLGVLVFIMLGIVIWFNRLERRRT
jgi:UDP-GlcNAc:undecaprenyl-phosphate GlcNAc-1-phosphate transferase